MTDTERLHLIESRIREEIEECKDAIRYNIERIKRARAILKNADLSDAERDSYDREIASRIHANCNTHSELIMLNSLLKD